MKGYYRNVVLGVLGISCWLACSAFAQELRLDSTAVASALKPGQATLLDALRISTSLGKALSGRYEIKNGSLQIVVFVLKPDDRNLSVIVDVQSGKIARTETSSNNEDIVAMQYQISYTRDATKTLIQAVSAAQKANPGFLAIGAYGTRREIPPEPGKGLVVEKKPVAQITLLRGANTKVVTEPLD